MKKYIALFLSLFLLAGCQQAETPATERETTTEATTETAEKSETGELVITDEMPKGIVPVEDWEEYFPEHVAMFQKNAEMVKTTYGGSEPIDYLEEHPYLKLFYEGYGFSKQYDRARGHVYALEDVLGTARPKRGASCLACKVSEFNVDLQEDPTLNLANFEEYAKENVTVGFTCFDCHGETPGQTNISRAHLTTAIEEYPKTTIADQSMSCAQCHVEYYMTPDENATTLPWSKGLGAEEAFAYYEGIEFSDWEHPTTGAKMLKAQHPEVETFDGSIHEEKGLSCLSCHMPQVEENGKTVSSHHWTSPLKNAEASCLPCHSNMDEEGIVKLAESMQKPVVERTEEVAKEIKSFIMALGEKKDSLPPETLEKLQGVHREAQFYWDYVFVENSEGFHNNKKALEYLDHASTLVQEAMSDLNQ